MLNYPLIGNDVIDLTQIETYEKITNEKWINRVFTLKEQELIYNGNSNPTITLWSLWSAKETAFKILKKIDSNVIFAHKKIEVLCTETTSEGTRGYVHYTNDNGSYNIPIRWIYESQWIHCYGIYCKEFTEYITKVETLKNTLHTIITLSEAEMASIYSPESKAVRILAKQLISSQFNLKNVEIIRKYTNTGFGPPLVFSNKELVNNIDISLSHDGAFVAAAINLRSKQN